MCNRWMVTSTRFIAASATRRDVIVDREVRQKGFNLGLTHRVRMADAMEANEPFDPVEVALFGSIRIVFHASSVPDAIQ